jgi:hypothetical protein
MHQRTPIKTEYAGTVFHSKSEAVFARALHLGQCEYWYQPETVCGHQWDFLVAHYEWKWPPSMYGYPGVQYTHTGGHWKKPWLTLVEYKPNEPTQTYIDNLIEKQRDCPFSSMIVWGSPWNGTVAPAGRFYVATPIFHRWYWYGWGDYDHICNCTGGQVLYAPEYDLEDLFGLTNEVAQEAKRYRFDLKRGGV